MSSYPGPLLEQVVVPGGKVRVFARLAGVEQRAYEQAVASVLPRIERGLLPGVLANRAAPSGALRGFSAERSTWRRELTAALRWSATLPGGAVASGDVQDCYPSISPDVVAARLAALGVDPAPVVGVLERFAHEGGRGLPVGPWPSAVLANAVLADADRRARAAGARVLRWVDDVVLVAPDRAHAARALDAWVRGLAVLGLTPHEGKTAIRSSEEAWDSLSTDGRPFVTLSPGKGLTRADAHGYRPRAHSPR